MIRKIARHCLNEKIWCNKMQNTGNKQYNAKSNYFQLRRDQYSDLSFLVQNNISRKVTCLH